tara:strand:+ start:106 stop:285 length:180 start_codon:yes stop_codon:yes gene_type:complete
MDKYLETLDRIYQLFHVKQSGKISPQLLKTMRHALDGEHDAGPEANYIIRVWKQERGYE